MYIVVNTCIYYAISLIANVMSNVFIHFIKLMGWYGVEFSTEEKSIKILQLDGVLNWDLSKVYKFKSFVK